MPTNIFLTTQNILLFFPCQKKDPELSIFCITHVRANHMMQASDQNQLELAPSIPFRIVRTSYSTGNLFEDKIKPAKFLAVRRR